MKLELAKSSQNLIQRYLNLKVGPWTVTCPYFKNERGLKNLPIEYSGKALPQELEKEANKFYNKKSKGLRSQASVRNLMILCSLGVDCSGLAVNILDLELKEKLGKSIYSIIKYPTLKQKLIAIFRPRTSISANVLTGNLNAHNVSVKNVRPGDLIRVGTFHVMIVEWVDGNKIGYVHSNSLPDFGVQRGEIEVTNPDQALENQKWSSDFDKEIYTNAKDRRLSRLNEF